MRTYRKTISVIELTKEEVDSLRDLIDQAEQGHTSHYAEKQMSDGKFFGVSVRKKEEADYENGAEASYKDYKNSRH